MTNEKQNTRIISAIPGNEEKFRCAHCRKAFHEIRFLNGQVVLRCKSCGRITELTKQAIPCAQ